MAKKKESQSLDELAEKLEDHFNSSNKIVKSNVFAIDSLLKGGFQLGSFVQIVAASGTGKSTMALQVCKNLIDQDYKVLYVDSEGSVTREMLESTGVIDYYKNGFYYINDSTFKDVEKQLDAFIATGEISFIVIDSLAAIVNEGYVNIGTDPDAKKSKGISITNNNTNNGSGPLVKFIGKYKSLATKNNICFLLINQFRNAVNMKTGSVKKNYGAMIVQYDSDVILEMNASLSKELSDFKSLTNTVNVGCPLELKIKKSNKSKPNVVLPAFLKYGVGLDNKWNYIYSLKKLGIIQQKNKYYEIDYFGDVIKAEGINAFTEILDNKGFNADTYEQLINYSNGNYENLEITIDGDEDDNDVILVEGD